MQIIGAVPGSLTDVPGVRIGHWQDPEAATGCSAILFDDPTPCGVDVKGGGPASREHALLSPLSHLPGVHGILLTGGSAFGLNAAGGVVRYLEEQGIGYPTRFARVPLVPASVLYDLGVGDPARRPGPDEGYQAAASAGDDRREGNVGAGCGATVGKLFGMERATKGGLGMARLDPRLGVDLAAVAVVNAIGEVVDPSTGAVLAGVRSLDGRGFDPILPGVLEGRAPSTLIGGALPSNTTLVVVAAALQLDKTEATRLARMAHVGVTRTIRPIHTPHDGDTLYFAATGSVRPEAHLGLVGAWAAEVVARAVVRAVQAAKGLAGCPAAHEVASA